MEFIELTWDIEVTEKWTRRISVDEIRQAMGLGPDEPVTPDMLEGSVEGDMHSVLGNHEDGNDCYQEVGERYIRRAKVVTSDAGGAVGM